MTNAELANHFTLLADLLEIQGENPFKIKSYTNAADTIESWPVEVAQLPDEALYQIPGIGQAIGEKIRELQHTGSMNALNKAMQAVPEGVREMLRIQGLSAKKIGAIWRALGVSTIDALEAAAAENSIAPLKGFGAKTQEGIAEAIAFYRQSLGHFMWAKAETMMLQLMDLLAHAFPQNRFEPTGTMRRQEDTVTAIELITDARPEALLDWVSGIEEAMMLNEKCDYPAMIFALPHWPICIVYTTEASQFASRWLATTGTAAFVAAIQADSVATENAMDEAPIFTQAGLPYIPPPLRMDASWLPKARSGALPQLIQPGDVRGLIHCHSTYSDGKATLQEMALAARDKGLEYMVISDHSQAAQYAKGLYPDRIAKQHREIDALNAQLAPFRIFKSIEVDILADGSLDYNEAVLSTLDLVIVSVHSSLKMDEAKAMKRLLKAIENPYTTILGHMTGRLLLRRPGYPVHHEKIIDACVANDVVIEINANPRRLDIDWSWIPRAMDKGVLLSVNPDAHSVAGIDDIRYGVLSAQKGGLTAQHNLSSYTLEAFEAFLKKYRIKRSER